MILAPQRSVFGLCLAFIRNIFALKLPFSAFYSVLLLNFAKLAAGIIGFQSLFSSE